MGAARNPKINIEIWDISEFCYPVGRILIGLQQLHVLKAFATTELEDWRAPKPDPDPCVEYTEDLEGAMLIPEATHEKELYEILVRRRLWACISISVPTSTMFRNRFFVA